MEALTPTEQEALKKCNTERLRLKLVKAGVDEELVVTMDRETLLNRVATSMRAPAATAVTPEVVKSTDMWQRELALREQELLLRREELEREETRRQEEFAREELRRKEELEREEVLRKEELARREEEKERADAMFRENEKRWHVEMELRKKEFEFREHCEAERRAAEHSLVGKTKKFADAVKQIFPRMPYNSAELPSYFESIENLFHMYDVPADI